MSVLDKIESRLIGTLRSAFSLGAALDARIRRTAAGVFAFDDGTGPGAIEVGTAGTAIYYDSTTGAGAAVSPAAHGRLRYNNTTTTWQSSVNGGAYVDFGSGIGGSLTLVLNPSAAVSNPADNVYKTWAEIQTVGAAIQAAGANFEIYWKVGGGFTFPVGGPYITGRKWIVDPPGGPYIQVPNGVTFSEWPFEVGPMELDFQGSSTVHTKANFYCTFEGLTYASGSAIPFVISGTSYVTLVNTGQSTTVGQITDGGIEVFDVSAGAELRIDLIGPETNVEQNTILGHAGSLLSAFMRDEQSSLWPQYFLVQTGFGATSITTEQLDQRYWFPGWTAGNRLTANKLLDAAEPNNNYAFPIDTSAGNVTITLPSSATIRQGPDLYSYSVTVNKITTDSNTIILARGLVTDKIQGVAASLDLSTLFPSNSLYSVTISAARAGNTFLGWYITSTTSSTAGAVQAIKVPVGFALGAVDSIAKIPAGAVILDAQVNVTTLYDGAGATITVGTPLFPTNFQTTANNTPSVINLYANEQQTSQAAAEVVEVTVGGTLGTTGAATVLVFYIIPVT
jgi:hypothetical protein